MTTRNLGTLVVRLALELAKYKGEWKEAEAATKQGVQQVEQTTGQATKAADQLTEALKRQTGAFGDAADTATDMASAARVATGASAVLTVGLGAVAAAVGVVTAAWVQGQRQQQQINDALLLTGNYAALVSGQLDQMAVSVASNIGGSVASARQVLAGLTATGRFTKESLHQVGEAVQLVARFSGQTSDEVLKHFAGMSDGVAKWAAKSNEAYHFLDIATYRYIQQLEEQGRKQEAMRVTSEALSRHLGGELTQNLGTLDRLWDKLKTSASNAWDAMRGVGRAETVQDRLDAANRAVDAAIRRYEQAKAGGSAMLGGGTAFELSNSPSKALADARTAQGVTQSDVIQERRLAENRSQLSQASEAAIKAEEKLQAIRDRARQGAMTDSEQLQTKIKEIRQLGVTAGWTAATIDELVKLEEKAAASRKSRKDPAQQEIERQKQLVAELAGLSTTFAADWDRLTRMHQAGALSVQQLTEAQAALLAKQPAIRANMKAEADELERLQRADIAAGKAREEHLSSLDKGLAKLQEEIAREQERAQTLGLSKAAIAELVAEKLEDQATTLHGQAIKEYDRNLDTAIYEGTMRQVAALQALAQAKRATGRKEEATESLKKQEKDWEDFVNNIDKTFHDGYLQMLQRGEDGWKAWTKSLRNTFKTAVADEIYKMFLKPTVLTIVGNLVGGTGTAASLASSAMAGGGSSMVGSALSSAFGLGGGFGGTALGSGVMSGLSAWGAGGSVTGLLGQGSALFAGGMANGLGVIAGALGPIALAAGVIYAISQKYKGEKRVGGQYSNTSLVDNPSGGAIAGADEAIAATMTSINSSLAALGSSARLQTLVSGLEQSERGKGFAYAGGALSTGAVFGQGVDGQGYMNRRGNMTSEQALQAFGEELKQATLQALQAADVPGLLGDYLRSLGDIDALSGGQLDAALARINKAITERQALDAREFALTASESEQRAELRRREVEALDASNHEQLRRIHQLEDEKRAAEAAAQAAERAAQERYGLETRLLQLQGRTQELRERELAQLDPANRELQRRIWALEDEAQALANAKEAAAAARAAIEDLMAPLTGATDLALDGLQRAVDAQMNLAQTARQVAQEQVNSLKSLFGVLQENVRSLYGEAAPQARAAEGREFINRALEAALSTGYLPDAAQLSDAIAAARLGMADGNYGSAFESQRDRLVLAGQLNQLQRVTGRQLSSAERQLQAADDQIRYLQDVASTARQQVDALRGVDTGVLSVRDAIDRLSQAILAEKTGMNRGLVGASGATEQWVGTKFGQVWESTGGAAALMTDAGLQIFGKTGNKFTGDQARSFVNERLAAGDERGIYDRALAEGISANSLEALMNWAAGSANARAAELNLPHFEAGGDHGGGWAIVGEKGRELAWMPPARIYSAPQSTQILAGGSDVARQLQQLQEDQRTQARELVSVQKRLLKLFEQWDGEGMPPGREAA